MADQYTQVKVSVSVCEADGRHCGVTWNPLSLWYPWVRCRQYHSERWWLHSRSSSTSQREYQGSQPGGHHHDHGDSMATAIISLGWGRNEWADTAAADSRLPTKFNAAEVPLAIVAAALVGAGTVALFCSVGVYV